VTVKNTVMNIIGKNHFKFQKKFDFNELANLIDRNNFKTFLNGNWQQEYIFDNAINIRNVEEDEFCKNIFLYLDNKLNTKNKKSDLHLYVNFASGGKSIAHQDPYNVYIIGLYGTTLYKNNKEEHYVNEGDVLEIKKGEEHRAIAITPRIIASYSFY
jgi:hypothetical protein